jgi:hypothetical protein
MGVLLGTRRNRLLLSCAPAGDDVGQDFPTCFAAVSDGDLAFFQSLLLRGGRPLCSAATRWLSSQHS